MTGLTMLSVFNTPFGLVKDVSGTTVYVGSGPGNATASIQDAIDNHAFSGDTVFVYAGTYNENVEVNKIINLTGENWDTTIIDGGGAEVVTITANWVNITGFTIVNGSYGLKISEASTNNNTISGNNISSHNRCGISLYESSDNTISGNNISSNDRDGIYLWSSTNNIIKGNNFLSNNLSGISLEESTENTISGNNISSHNDCGIYLWYSSNNTLSDNDIKNNYQGIFIYLSSNNTRVSSNTISENNNGIFIKTASYCTITGNNFSNNIDGVDCEVSSNNNRIMGNNFFSNTDCAIELDLTSNNNTVSGNNVTDSTQGIFLSGSSNNTIARNNIYSNSDSGVFLDTASNNNTISGNIITNNLEGIYLIELFNNTIVGNNISSNTDCGIFFHATSNNNTISGNNITSNDFNGIYLVGASNNNTISDNNISSNSINGIYLSKSSNNTITDNNISLNKDHGIYFDSASDNTITGNNISSNILNGIYLNGASNNNIVGNKVLNNSHGLYLDPPSNNNTIAGNNISSNAVNGISIWQSSNNTITGNNISSNIVNGISFWESSNNTVTGNNISNNDDGIRISTSSHDNRITRNYVYSNLDDGISIGSFIKNITMAGNTIINNSYGIYLDSTSQNNTIIGNNISSNNLTGIYVWSSKYNIITDNNISSNNVRGIYMGGSSDYNTITGNNFFGNGDGIRLGSSSKNNTIAGNNVSSNSNYGIFLSSSKNNRIYHNNIVNNTNQAFDDAIWDNQWDNGYPSGGNYWGDYVGVDIFNGPLQDIPGSDWIGDTNYTIDTDSVDRYPLMLPTFLIPPIIRNVSADPDLQETGGWINISCNVTDNFGVYDVRVNITLPGGGYINESLTKGPDDQWYYNNTPIPPGPYQYTIWASDIDNNWNCSSGYNFMIQDTTLPVISNVLEDPDIQETGGWVNITCDVNDNIGVYVVRVNITLPGGGFTNDSMIQGSGDQWYYNSTHKPLGLYQYNIWANDTSNNWIDSSGHMFTIWDIDLPEIINPTATPQIQKSGGSVNITVVVTDNIGVVEVWVNITFPNASSVNITMIKSSQGKWYLNSTYLDMGTYSYTIWAKDTSGNWNGSFINTFTIVDLVKPVISDVNATPVLQSAGSKMNITCNITDFTGIYAAWVNITTPDGSNVNVSLIRGSGDLWFHNTLYFDPGIYDYAVWTNDSFGNWNTSGGHTFTIVPGLAFNIILISGHGQSGLVGAPLTGPLVIEVQDWFGNTVSNAMVWFNVTVGVGSLDPVDPVLTDQSGRAVANLTLGNISGANEVTAEIAGSGITQVIFNATAEPGAPYRIVIVSGNNAQTGFIGTDLDNAFAVEVFDRFGNLVPNAQVWFNVTAGGGFLDTSNPILTDAQGRVQTTLTLGVNPGSNTVTAEIGGGGITQVIFTAFGLSNEPVINKAISNIELIEDGPPFTLDLSTHAVDDVDSSQDLIWFITNSDNSLYTVSGQGTDTLVITTKPNEYGNDLVTLWVMDSDGLQDSQSLWINITPENDKPFFFPKPPALTITGDVPYMFDYGPYIHDVDNDPGELSITTSDQDHTSSNGHRVTYNYPSSMIGQQVFLILTLSDGPDDASEVIQVNISHDNVPVVTRELPDITMYEDEIRLDVFDLDEYFDDPDGDAIYFSYGYSHINIKINENHSVDLVTEGNWFGQETVTFRASDPDYAIAEDTITVIVLPRNDPPSISGAPDLVVHYNATYHFDLTPYISDIDNTTAELGLFFTEFLGGIWVRSDHIHVSAGNNLRMAINYSKAHLGTVFEVMIQVNDGLSVAYDVINITVSEDWPPELVKEMPDIVFYEDERLSNHFNVHNFFRDPDGDALFYTYGQVHIGVEIRENGSVDFYSDPNWYGTENITIRAADPHGGLAEDIITVTVVPVNDNPALSQIPDQEGASGEIWILDLGPYISDVDNNITELEIECDSQYIIIAGTVLIFQYPGDMTGDTVRITATDPANGSATAVFNTTLAKAGMPDAGGVEIVQYILTIILIIAILAAILLLYVYQRGKYELEELFLVYGESGNLISNSYRGEMELENRDIMASMFTAVQDFISDAFDHEDHSRVPLKVMEIGDKKIMIERGEYTYLAAVFKGGTWRLASRIKKAVVNLEAEYADILEDWDGDMDVLKGVQKHLDDLMDSK